MDLLSSLAKLPLEQLNRIAHSVGVDPDADRRALEQELASCLTDRAWLQGLLADLSDDEWAALKVVFFNGGDQGITVELCHQIVNLLSGRRRKTPAKAIEDLQNRGLIYPRTQNYRQVFFIPVDLLTALRDILSRQMVYRICIPADSDVRYTTAERDLLEDTHRFLAYVHRTEITLTQQGQIFKRHLRALLDLLGSAGEDDENLVGRYPEPLGFLMGYALERRLLVREDGKLVTTPLLGEWVGWSTGAKQADLFRYWQDRYYYQDLQTFLSVMRQVGEQWVSVSRLVLELEPLINPSQRGSFLIRLKHHLTTFLAPFGLLLLGETEGSEEPELVCRLTPVGVAVLAERTPEENDPMAVAPFLLQATFEILASRPVPARVLWTLELMADLVGRTDRTLTYRLSRQSIYRALRGGMTGEQMLAFLREHSATGVPQNVEFDLRSWAEGYGQVYLQAVVLLRCANEILAEQVKASRRTSRFVLGELTPTDLVVAEESYKELLEALEADGLMPRPGLERPGANTKKQDA